MSRFTRLYVIGYFALVGGAARSMWKAGLLTRISPARLALIALLVVGLGVALALLSAGSTAPKVPKRHD
jgi:hypothetical protein